MNTPIQADGHEVELKSCPLCDAVMILVFGDGTAEGKNIATGHHHPWPEVGREGCPLDGFIVRPQSYAAWNRRSTQAPVQGMCSRNDVLEEVRYTLDKEFENGSPPDSWDDAERAVERCRETVNELIGYLKSPAQGMCSPQSAGGVPHYLIYTASYPAEGAMYLVVGRDGVEHALATSLVFGEASVADVQGEHRDELDALMGQFDDPDEWSGSDLSFSFEDGSIHVVRIADNLTASSSPISAAGEKVSEQDCPNHVASADDPKVCGRCGVHIDSLRPEEDDG